MSAQEIFDTVAKHLAAQGHRAIEIEDGGKNCMYRAPNGDKCAAGCLIPDVLYDPKIETSRISYLIETDNPSTRHLQGYRDLVLALQLVHDGVGVGVDVARDLRRIARDHHLSPAILDTLTFPEVWA